MNNKKLAVLIPAYKAKYMDDVIQGLNLQTYKNFDVFISDDSVGEQITERLKLLEKRGSLEGLNIQLNTGPKDGRLNHLLLDRQFSPNYDYIHFHHDDDYIYPTFYEEHLRAHEYGDFAASISQRWISNENNIPFAKPVNVSLGEDNRLFFPLTIELLTKSSLPHSVNWLGELTNTVFKGNGNAIFALPPIDTSSLNYYGLTDIGTFLDLAQTKNLVYIRSYISNWRSHSEQSTHQIGSHGIRLAVLCWLAYAVKAHNDNLIDDNDLFKAINRQKSFLTSRVESDDFYEKPLDLIIKNNSLVGIKEDFTEWWVTLLEIDRLKIKNAR